MKKYTHFEDEISGEVEPSLGKFLLQMLAVAIVGALILLFY
tara:strand:+ start:3338 stop:3460 length:123 start_codon:yes stop_codon:yes gene_type:complete